MINDTSDTSPQPLLAFPDLDSGFPQLPAEAADAYLTDHLQQLQQVPAEEASPDWTARLGQTVFLLLVAASAHSQEVQDSLIGRLARWTVDGLLNSDATAAQLLVTLAEHSPRSVALAGHAIVTRLVKQQQPLPAWTATLIGLLRQASGDAETDAIAQAALALLPDWRTALSQDTFAQVLAANDANGLLQLVGHFSLLSCIDVTQEPGLPMSQTLAADELAAAIAPDMLGIVHHYLNTEPIRLHWLLTPQGKASIAALLDKACALGPAETPRNPRQEIVLGIARCAAIAHGALSGAEAALLLAQLLHWVEATAGDNGADAWGPVWMAVRQLSSRAQPRPSRTAPDSDRSRTVSTLLCPTGLSGNVVEVGWCLALLKQHGLTIADCVGELVRQVPRSPNDQPLLARVLLAMNASAPEHLQALAELCAVKGCPAHIGASLYTEHLLSSAYLLALQSAHAHDESSAYLGGEDVLRQVSACLPPGLLTLGLFSHLKEELKFLSYSPSNAIWMAAQLQACVQALPPGVPKDWVRKVWQPIVDDMEGVLDADQCAQLNDLLMNR